MSKRDKSLLDLENKIGKNNEKENILKNMRINKPNMKMDLLNNNKFNKGNLLSFLDKFKKENEKILNDDNKLKYNIENNPQEEEESDEENNNNNMINLDENEENENKEKEKTNNNNKKGTKIEMDLLMGILEQQKKKEISIENIIQSKKNENLNDEDIINADTIKV